MADRIQTLLTAERRLLQDISHASRQLRRGVPADVRELEPLVERLIFGLAPVE